MATETDTTHIDDDDDADPRASPFPPSHLAAPRYVAVAAAITAPPRRRTCFHARRAPWEMRAQGQSCCVSRERCHVAILNSSRDHRRGFVRRVAARKLKFHVKRILARGRRAEKPPLARALHRPTPRTSRCDAVMNRDERQRFDTTPLRRNSSRSARHTTRRGCDGEPPNAPRSPRAWHVSQPRVRTMMVSNVSYVVLMAFGVRVRHSASRRHRVTRRARRRGGPRRLRSRSLPWPRSRP